LNENAVKLFGFRHFIPVLISHNQFWWATSRKSLGERYMQQ